MGGLRTQTILKKLVRIPSVTGNIETCREIVVFAQKVLNFQKISSKILKLNNRFVLVWGETNLARTTWLVNSHLDVVPGKPEQFRPHIKGGQLWGRGSADSKGSAAVLLSSALKWQNAAKDKHLTFMLVADEEAGGESTKKLLKLMKNLKGGIFLEPTGEKIITQAKGIMQVKLSVTGKSCHGSRPWDGINALELLISSLNKFRLKHPTPSKETKRTTFNFSIFQGNASINQVPSEASLWCDVRWNPTDNPKLIISEFKNIFLNAKVEVVKLESPIACPHESAILSSFSEAMQKSHIRATKGFEHGSSDARHCTAKNIPAIVFGPKGENLHGENEWVSSESLKNVSTVLNTWISDLN